MMMEAVPRLPFRMASIKNTAKVCIVKGTVVGMLIHEQMAISTAPIAIYVRSRVLVLLFMIYSPLPIAIYQTE